jgi:hypothetical protein
MASVKATFTLDEESAAKLALTSRRLNRPKSAIVREAIVDYSKRSEKLSESERLRMLRVIDEFKDLPPTRSQAEVDAEIAEIRESRRLSGVRRSRALGE